jgi:hypothetical protein
MTFGTHLVCVGAFHGRLPHYNREVKRLKKRVRKPYNRSKYGQNHQTQLKRISKELLLAKKEAQEIFLRSVLRNEG